MARFENPASILITGASAGIGEALALHYAAPGVTLFLGGRDRERLDVVLERCEEKGAKAHGWIGEVTDADALRRWIQDSDGIASLELVIANAGIALGSITVEGLHQAAIDTLDVNVVGVMNTIHPALECMSRRKPYPVKRAQVAIVSSVMGYAGTARSPAYCASKAAVKTYGEALRGAFRGMGIGVSVICPGYVTSRMIAKDSGMPFQIEADKAAKIIARGLAKDKARITFPWQVTLIARLVINLPGFLLDRINQPWGVPRLEDNS